MSWVKLDDNFVGHPKVVGLSDRAFRVHVRAISYSARQLTDGHIPAGALRELAASRKAVTELISASLWHESGDGYQINDYLAYNPSRSKVLADRAKNSRKIKEWRKGKNETGM